MPQLIHTITREEIKEKVTQIDLTPYTTILETIQQAGGVGGDVTLEPGEDQRTQKRRLSLAAKELDLNLVWRKSDTGQLKFVIASAGEPIPGSRKARKAMTKGALESVPEEPSKESDEPSEVQQAA